MCVCVSVCVSNSTLSLFSRSPSSEKEKEPPRGFSEQSALPFMAGNEDENHTTMCTRPKDRRSPKYCLKPRYN